MNDKANIDVVIDSFDRLERYIADDWGVTSPEYEQYRQARDAIGDLINAAMRVLGHRVGALPNLGYIRDDRLSRKDIGDLAECLSRVTGAPK